MSINAIMQSAMRNNWAMTDDFQFQFSNPKYPLSVNSPLSPNDLLTVSTMNIDLPEFNAQVETVLQGGEYRMYSRKFQPFRVTVTFRDIHGLALKSYFTKIWIDQQRAYFDEIKSTLIVSMNQRVVFQSDSCLIENISQTQVDNSNSQIAEFSVSFTTPFFTNFEIQKFGKQLASSSSLVSRSSGSGSFNVFNIASSILSLF